MFVFLFLANASQWDKQEMHSELELMQGMPPHLNIVNFLGMCSETGERRGELVAVNQ